MSNKTFCTYPWEHLFVNPTGHLRLCCDASENITKDDGYRHYNMANNDELFDCWNSDYMVNTRKKMLAGEKVDACRKCYDKEARGLTSKRNPSNYDLYKSLTEDGKFVKKPGHIELHFGNVCNLACKMCSQEYSHKIGQEILKMGDEDPDFLKWVKTESGTVNNWTSELDIVYDWFKEPRTKERIFSYVSKNVDSLTIIGGEPTAVKEFYELLDYCSKENTLKDKGICITTNMTNISKKMVSWFNEAKEIVIYGSADGIGEVNDYIRYPSKWQVIEKSLYFYANLIKQSKDNKLVIGPTMQSLNIHDMVNFLHYFEKFSKEVELDIDIWRSGVVDGPSICDYRVLPDSYKNYVADKLKNEMIILEDEANKSQVLSHIDALQKNNDQSLPYKKQILKSFVKYNDSQDRHRKSVTWRQLIPELEQHIDNFINL